jgi:hypothetical protein
LSVTITWNAKVPVAVVVPVKRPELLNVVPVGIDPLTVNVYGGMPPVAPNWILTAAPEVTVLIVDALTVKGGGATVKVKLCDAVAWLESVTSTEKVKGPGAVGVPNRMPSRDMVSPGGRLPLDTVNTYEFEPPLAAITVL